MVVKHMSIFDSIKSLIPEDKQSDVKTLIDGKVRDVVTQTKKELSGKYGVNFFEDDVTKAYDNKAFVKREIYDNVQKELEVYNTKLETLQKEKEELETDLGTYKSKSTQHELTLKLLEEGINPKRIGVVNNFKFDGKTVDERVTQIKTTLPELFTTETQFRNPNPNNDDEENISEAEKYFKKQLRK